MVSIETTVLLALSLLVGLFVLLENHRPRSMDLRLWRRAGGRAAAGAAVGAVSPARSCARLATDVVAVLCIVNSVVSYTGERGCGRPCKGVGDRKPPPSVAPLLGDEASSPCALTDRWMH
jgi:uncharacterized membrane protein YfcA